MNKNSIQYMIYLLSYLFVYPFSLPLLIIITFATESPTVPQNVLDLTFLIFSVFVTLAGTIMLNYLFKRYMKLKKNNSKSSVIFVSHLILIPLTYIMWVHLSH